MYLAISGARKPVRFIGLLGRPRRQVAPTSDELQFQLGEPGPCNAWRIIDVLPEKLCDLVSSALAIEPTMKRWQ